MEILRKKNTYLAAKNIMNRPFRSVGMALLAAFLSLTVFAGTIITQSLARGVSSLEDRLGADIMVVPYEAATQQRIEDIVLQGNTGYFYMNGDVVESIASVDGVGQVTAQYYLASVSAGCCSIPVQIIGYDPATDFVITPWIIRSQNGPDNGDIGYLDVVVGNDLNAFVGDKMTFYGVDVRVAAKLDKTGTAYDTAVFTTHDTIVTLIEASVNKKLNEYANINGGNVVSCVLVDAADGYDVEDVLHNVNIAAKKTKAIRTKQMIAGIADSLSGISRIAGILVVVVWTIALFVMMTAFFVMTNERRKEFALLRVTGASNRRLSGIVLTEGLLLALWGSAVGVLLGALFLFPFGGFIENTIGLPFLLPGVAETVGVAVVSVLVAAVAGALAAGVSAYRIGVLDAGAILRTEN